MKSNNVVISLEEYKELLLNKDNQLRDNEKILFDKMIDYIKEHVKYDKDGWNTVKGLELKNFKEDELLRMIQYIDSYLFLDIYKYATDNSYKEEQDRLKMEKARAMKSLKQELRKEEEEKNGK